MGTVFVIVRNEAIQNPCTRFLDCFVVPHFDKLSDRLAMTLVQYFYHITAGTDNVDTASG
jgi:hypothetical protein